MEQIRNRLGESRLCQRVFIILMIIYGAAGLFLFDDYGCGPDEGMERQTSLVNFRYALHKLNLPVSEKAETWMEYLPELKEYRDRYYGTALHFPLVLAEYFSDFTLSPAQFYGLRHLYTFLNYYVGVICVYRLLVSRFRSHCAGLAGALMMILTPRLFGESFYNNKDLIFLAWYVICTLLSDRWLKKRSLKLSVLLAFGLALTCNTRFNGIIFIPVLVFLFLFDGFRKKNFSGWQKLILTLLLSLIFFCLITPNFWENPVQTLFETVQFNMHHPNHGSAGNLFKGVLVDASKTLTYIPVWIAVTVPTVYLLFTLAGACWYLVSIVRSAVGFRLNDIDLTDVLLFLTGFGAVIFIILTHVTIYNGWRHCYFAYPCFVYFAVYFLWNIFRKKAVFLPAVCFVLLCVSFVWNGVWIVRNHPFEYVYFITPIQDRVTDFSGDYWSIGSRALLEYITDSDPERMLMVNHAHSQAGSINRGLLPEEKRQYLVLTYEDTPDVDYYIVCRDEIGTVDVVPDGYEKVFSVAVDKDEIGAVFKKK